jgi:hypothetical protein
VRCEVATGGKATCLCDKKIDRAAGEKYDHTTSERSRHGTTFPRWRPTSQSIIISSINCRAARPSQIVGRVLLSLANGRIFMDQQRIR